MTFSFRPARRSEAKPLIGIYAESGCGKTFSSLLLARGFVGPAGKIGMIETEGGRGEAFMGLAPMGDYEVCPIRGDFSPVKYGEAITAAEGANLDALIVDSASQEWEGAGGVLSMAADNQANGVKGVLVWQQPKMQHQRNFMLRLLQTPIPLVIVCMRAKYPMIQKGKDWVRSDVLEPKQADDILFEMFVHGWIDQAHKLHVTKYTIPELADVIKDGEPITIKTGQQLATWAKGGTTSAASNLPPRAADQGGEAEPPGSDLAPDLLKAATDAAKKGTADYRTFWANCEGFEKKALQDHHERLKVMATEADAKQGAMV